MLSSYVPQSPAADPLLPHVSGAETLRGRNFHIYVHANDNLLEQGVDEHGRKFYKLYYEEES